MDLINLVLSVISLVFILYYFIRKRYAFWSDRDVPFIKPTFPFGNFKGIGSTIHIGIAMTNFYNELKGKFPFAGLFMFTNPMVLITDLDLMKNIFIKDFNYFTDHGLYTNEKDDPLSYNLFGMEGARWKILRTKLTPTFTSGKMKTMFPTMAAVGVELKKCIDREIKKDSQIEIKDIVGRFTTDMIASCAFGIDCNSLEDSDNSFNKMAKKFFEEPNVSGLQSFLVIAFEEISKKLGIKFVPEDVTDFYTKIVKETISYREQNDIKRNDFMNLLLQLKNKGKLDDDLSSSGKSDYITTQEIINQSFIFLAAGYETSSTTMSFALNELIANPDIQEKLRNEINETLDKYNGEITYESIMEMKYLEQVIYETLRKYPILPILNRIATADYLVPGTKNVIAKGTKVIIPIYAVQHDKEYFPDPEKFDPDRFTKEEVQKRHAMTFLSFGDGPRVCIGQRFGLMQAKVGLVTLLTNYKFTKSDKTNYPVTFALSSMSTMIAPEGGVFLNIEKV